MSRIAQRAGVTVQTLYLAWGSKRALLRALMTESLAHGAGEPDTIAGRFAGKSGPEITAHLAALVATTAGSAAACWKLYRDAAATDDEIAADWDQLQSLRRDTMARIVAHIPTDALRPGLSLETARDTAWTIASPESYDLLVRRAGYSLDEFERWMAATLTTALLA